MSGQLWTKSAGELAGMIRDRSTSSREVVEAHIERIGEVNSTVNAVTIVLADDALAAADKADASEPDGPFHGVPFSVKENIDLLGSSTTMGIPALVDNQPTVDAPTVTRMKNAGAIPLSRTNMPELGLRVSTDNPLRGRTNNAWSPDLTAGGSSGGEGAALATGMSPIGLGNDIGGSLRNPAFCNGVTSLKPTRGRIPQARSTPPTDPGLSGQLLLSEGPMARRVADLRTAFGVLAGRDPRDPSSVDAPLIGPEPQQRVAAVVTELPGPAFGDSVSAAIQAAAGALEDDGWDLVEITPPDIDLIATLWGHTMAMDLEVALPLISAVLSETAVATIELLCAVYPSSAMPPAIVQTERRRVEREWSAFFTEYPVVVGPTWTRDPFLHDADLGESGMEMLVDYLRFITPGNLLGLPSVCVPTGITATGLAGGVQIYADHWREDLALDAAQAVEDRLGIITPIDPR